MKRLLVLALLATPAVGQSWDNLLRGGLDKWDILGDGIWRLRSDGVLVAHRNPNWKRMFAGRESITERDFQQWDGVQSWLYTKKEYEEFDLHLDYFLRTPGNSGISIRDPSRAEHGLSHPPDFRRTPSKLGYEIQINSDWPDRWTTGSIYGLAAAKAGVQKLGEWNSMNIESRKDAIRVFLNSELVAEHPGDPKRPTKGPIGLQLHDQFSFVMFRNVWVMERTSPEPE